jgi:predicted ABC-type transport system involved in lysophospholipase L1 biosynthesis ATPase subunit
VTEKLKESGKSLKRHERAGEVMKMVALKTQQQLQYHISDITTMALDAVFPDPYELVAEFVQRRNKTECDLLFEREGERVDPLSASGGGAVDVASFALRVASWSMERPRLRNTLILDEPFRYLSAGLLPKASEMLSRISREMGIQVIMVTHSEELMEGADRVFTVSQRKGISKVN